MIIIAHDDGFVRELLDASMFRRSSPHSLKLPVGETVFEFVSPENFAFALAGRAGVPGSRVSQLIGMSSESLRREAEAIRMVEQKFNDALDGVLRDVTRIGPFLREMDLNLVSQDHDWRSIISAMLGLDESYEQYKKVALVKYVQYLAARRQAVTAIYSGRQQGKQASSTDSEVDGKLRETALFDMAEFHGSDPDGFARMPKGETVDIDVATEGRVSVLLAKHKCHIESNGSLQFVDDAEAVTLLRVGKNIVGRDAHCDVMVNASYRDISRRHLIIEVESDQRVRLTDISSHGTSLSARLLENTSI